MANNSGRLAAAVPPGGQDVELFACAAGRKAVGTLTFNNRARTNATISLAVTAGGAPAAADWMFEEMLMDAIPATVTGLVVGGGQKIFVRTSGFVGVTYNGAVTADT